MCPPSSAAFGRMPDARISRFILLGRYWNLAFDSVAVAYRPFWVRGDDSHHRMNLRRLIGWSVGPPATVAASITLFSLQEICCRTLSTNLGKYLTKLKLRKCTIRDPETIFVTTYLIYLCTL